MKQHYRLASRPSAFSSCELGGLIFAIRRGNSRKLWEAHPRALSSSNWELRRTTLMVLMPWLFAYWMSCASKRGGNASEHKHSAQNPGDGRSYMQSADVCIVAAASCQERMGRANLKHLHADSGRIRACLPRPEAAAVCSSHSPCSTWLSHRMNRMSSASVCGLHHVVLARPLITAETEFPWRRKCMCRGATIAASACDAKGLTRTLQTSQQGVIAIK